MHHVGVRHFVDLTEEGELRPYHQQLPNDTTYLRFPIQDVNVPKSVEAVHQLIDKMEYLMQQDGYFMVIAIPITNWLTPSADFVRRM